MQILVTGIGGNVGQGILRNLRASRPEATLIGTDVARVTGGSHLCEQTFVTPYAYEPSYVDEVERICAGAAVELIIPSTDYETYYLSLEAHRLPPVACSPAETNRIFLDKLESFRFFSSQDIPFAKTVPAADYQGPLEQVIAKPREGRGSRGIILRPESLTNLGADMIIQPFLEGDELTTAFFIDKNRRLHGMITMRRSLQAGMTSLCEVVTGYDRVLGDLIEKLNRSLVVRGSCNIQSIAISSSEVVPFEVNGRISGTNSIRSHFGFTDVDYTVRDFLTGESLPPVKIMAGCATRLMIDVIYPGQTLEAEKNSRAIHFVN